MASAKGKAVYRKRGETAECVAQGLKDIFHHLGGVPSQIVFDNASGIGRRIRDKVSFAELFLRFKCHYGFAVRFCNPESAHEKGNVENKVGYIRRNFFVPIPVVDSIEAWNLQLLEQVEEDFQRLHYKKGRPIAQLLEEARAGALAKDRIEHLPEPGHLVLVKGALAEGWKLSVNSEQSTVESSLVTDYCLLYTFKKLGST